MKAPPDFIGPLWPRGLERLSVTRGHGGAYRMYLCDCRSLREAQRRVPNVLMAYRDRSSGGCYLDMLDTPPNPAPPQKRPWWRRIMG